MTQTDHRAGQAHVDGNPQFRALMGLGISIAELEVLRRAGYVERDRRRNNQAYWRLRFRHLGRLRSVYLGNDGLLVDQVRYELETLQAKHRKDQELARAVRQSKQRLRVLKARLATKLAGIGLHYHGDQLRKRRVRAEAQSAT